MISDSMTADAEVTHFNNHHDRRLDITYAVYTQTTWFEETAVFAINPLNHPGVTKAIGDNPSNRTVAVLTNYNTEEYHPDKRQFDITSHHVNASSITTMVPPARSHVVKALHDHGFDLLENVLLSNECVWFQDAEVVAPDDSRLFE